MSNLLDRLASGDNNENQHQAVPQQTLSPWERDLAQGDSRIKAPLRWITGGGSVGTANQFDTEFFRKADEEFRRAADEKRWVYDSPTFTGIYLYDDGSETKRLGAIWEDGKYKGNVLDQFREQGKESEGYAYLLRLMEGSEAAKTFRQDKGTGAVVKRRVEELASENARSKEDFKKHLQYEKELKGYQEAAENDYLGEAVTVGGSTLAGASLGSFFGPGGTLVGGVAGFGYGLLANWLGESDAALRQEAEARYQWNNGSTLNGTKAVVSWMAGRTMQLASDPYDSALEQLHGAYRDNKTLDEFYQENPDEYGWGEYLTRYGTMALDGIGLARGAGYVTSVGMGITGTIQLGQRLAGTGDDVFNPATGQWMDSSQFSWSRQLALQASNAINFIPQAGLFGAAGGTGVAKLLGTGPTSKIVSTVQRVFSPYTLGKEGSVLLNPLFRERRKLEQAASKAGIDDLAEASLERVNVGGYTNIIDKQTGTVLLTRRSATTYVTPSEFVKTLGPQAKARMAAAKTTGDKARVYRETLYRDAMRTERAHALGAAIVLNFAGEGVEEGVQELLETYAIQGRWDVEGAMSAFMRGGLTSAGTTAATHVGSKRQAVKTAKHLETIFSQDTPEGRKLKELLTAELGGELTSKRLAELVSSDPLAIDAVFRAYNASLNPAEMTRIVDQARAVNNFVPVVLDKYGVDYVKDQTPAQASLQPRMAAEGAAQLDLTYAGNSLGVTGSAMNARTYLQFMRNRVEGAKQALKEWLASLGNTPVEKIEESQLTTLVHQLASGGGNILGNLVRTLESVDVADLKNLLAYLSLETPEAKALFKQRHSSISFDQLVSGFEHEAQRLKTFLLNVLDSEEEFLKLQNELGLPGVDLSNLRVALFERVQDLDEETLLSNLLAEGNITRFPVTDAETTRMQSRIHIDNRVRNNAIAASSTLVNRSQGDFDGDQVQMMYQLVIHSRWDTASSALDYWYDLLSKDYYLNASLSTVGRVRDLRSFVGIELGKEVLDDRTPIIDSEAFELLYASLNQETEHVEYSDVKQLLDQVAGMYYQRASELIKENQHSDDLQSLLTERFNAVLMFALNSEVKPGVSLRKVMSNSGFNQLVALLENTVGDTFDTLLAEVAAFSKDLKTSYKYEKVSNQLWQMLGFAGEASEETQRALSSTYNQVTRTMTDYLSVTLNGQEATEAKQKFLNALEDASKFLNGVNGRELRQISETKEKGVGYPLLDPRGNRVLRGAEGDPNASSVDGGIGSPIPVRRGQLPVYNVLRFMDGVRGGTVNFVRRLAANRSELAGSEEVQQQVRDLRKHIGLMVVKSRATEDTNFVKQLLSPTEVTIGISDLQATSDPDRLTVNRIAQVLEDYFGVQVHNGEITIRDANLVEVAAVIELAVLKAYADSDNQNYAEFMEDATAKVEAIREISKLRSDADALSLAQEALSRFGDLEFDDVFGVDSAEMADVTKSTLINFFASLPDGEDSLSLALSRLGDTDYPHLVNVSLKDLAVRDDLTARNSFAVFMKSMRKAVYYRKMHEDGSYTFEGLLKNKTLRTGNNLVTSLVEYFSNSDVAKVMEKAVKQALGNNRSLSTNLADTDVAVRNKVMQTLGVILMRGNIIRFTWNILPPDIQKFLSDSLLADPSGVSQLSLPAEFVEAMGELAVMSLSEAYATNTPAFRKMAEAQAVKMVLSFEKTRMAFELKRSQTTESRLSNVLKRYADSTLLRYAIDNLSVSLETLTVDHIEEAYSRLVMEDSFEKVFDELNRMRAGSRNKAPLMLFNMTQDDLHRGFLSFGNPTDFESYAARGKELADTVLREAEALARSRESVNQFVDQVAKLNLYLDRASDVTEAAVIDSIMHDVSAANVTFVDNEVLYEVQSAIINPVSASDYQNRHSKAADVAGKGIAEVIRQYNLGGQQLPDYLIQSALNRIEGIDIELLDLHGYRLRGNKEVKVKIGEDSVIVKIPADFKELHSRLTDIEVQLFEKVVLQKIFSNPTVSLTEKGSDVVQSIGTESIFGFKQSPKEVFERNQELNKRAKDMDMLGKRTMLDMVTTAADREEVSVVLNAYGTLGAHLGGTKEVLSTVSQMFAQLTYIKQLENLITDPALKEQYTNLRETITSLIQVQLVLGDIGKLNSVSTDTSKQREIILDLGRELVLKGKEAYRNDLLQSVNTVDAVLELFKSAVVSNLTDASKFKLQNIKLDSSNLDEALQTIISWLKDSNMSEAEKRTAQLNIIKTLADNIQQLQLMHGNPAIFDPKTENLPENQWRKLQAIVQNVAQGLDTFSILSEDKNFQTEWRKLEVAAKQTNDPKQLASLVKKARQLIQASLGFDETKLDEELAIRWGLIKTSLTRFQDGAGPAYYEGIAKGYAANLYRDGIHSLVHGLFVDGVELQAKTQLPALKEEDARSQFESVAKASLATVNAYLKMQGEASTLLDVKDVAAGLSLTAHTQAGSSGLVTGVVGTFLPMGGISSSRIPLKTLDARDVTVVAETIEIDPAAWLTSWNPESLSLNKQNENVVTDFMHLHGALVSGDLEIEYVDSDGSVVVLTAEDAYELGILEEADRLQDNSFHLNASLLMDLLTTVDQSAKVRVSVNRLMANSLQRVDGEGLNGAAHRSLVASDRNLATWATEFMKRNAGAMLERVIKLAKKPEQGLPRTIQELSVDDDNLAKFQLNLADDPIKALERLVLDDLAGQKDLREIPVNSVMELINWYVFSMRFFVEGDTVAYSIYDLPNINPEAITHVILLSEADVLKIRQQNSATPQANLINGSDFQYPYTGAQEAASLNWNGKTFVMDVVQVESLNLHAMQANIPAAKVNSFMASSGIENASTASALAETRLQHSVRLERGFHNTRKTTYVLGSQVYEDSFSPGSHTFVVELDLSEAELTSSKKFSDHVKTVIQAKLDPANVGFSERTRLKLVADDVIVIRLRQTDLTSEQKQQLASRMADFSQKNRVHIGIVDVALPAVSSSASYTRGTIRLDGDVVEEASGFIHSVGQTRKYQDSLANLTLNVPANRLAMWITVDSDAVFDAQIVGNAAYHKKFHTTKNTTMAMPKVRGYQPLLSGSSASTNLIQPIIDILNSQKDYLMKSLSLPNLQVGAKSINALIKQLETMLTTDREISLVEGRDKFLSTDLIPYFWFDNGSLRVFFHVAGRTLPEPPDKVVKDGRVTLMATRFSTNNSSTFVGDLENPTLTNDSIDGVVYDHMIHKIIGDGSKGTIHRMDEEATAPYDEVAVPILLRSFSDTTKAKGPRGVIDNAFSAADLSGWDLISVLTSNVSLQTLVRNSQLGSGRLDTADDVKRVILDLAEKIGGLPLSTRQSAQSGMSLIPELNLLVSDSPEYRLLQALALYVSNDMAHKVERANEVVRQLNKPSAIELMRQDSINNVLITKGSLASFFGNLTDSMLNGFLLNIINRNLNSLDMKVLDNWRVQVGVDTSGRLVSLEPVGQEQEHSEIARVHSEARRPVSNNYSLFSNGGALRGTGSIDVGFEYLRNMDPMIGYLASVFANRVGKGEDYAEALGREFDSLIDAGVKAGEFRGDLTNDAVKFLQSVQSQERTAQLYAPIEREQHGVDAVSQLTSTRNEVAELLGINPKDAHSNPLLTALVRMALYRLGADADSTEYAQTRATKLSTKEELAALQTLKKNLEAMSRGEEVSITTDFVLPFLPGPVMQSLNQSLLHSKSPELRSLAQSPFKFTMALAKPVLLGVQKVVPAQYGYAMDMLYSLVYVEEFNNLLSNISTHNGVPLYDLDQAMLSLGFDPKDPTAQREFEQISKIYAQVVAANRGDITAPADSVLAEASESLDSWAKANGMASNPNSVGELHRKGLPVAELAAESKFMQTAIMLKLLHSFANPVLIAASIAEMTNVASQNKVADWLTGVPNFVSVSGPVGYLNWVSTKSGVARNIRDAYGWDSILEASEYAEQKLSVNKELHREFLKEMYYMADPKDVSATGILGRAISGLVRMQDVTFGMLHRGVAKDAIIAFTQYLMHQGPEFKGHSVDWWIRQYADNPGEAIRLAGVDAHNAIQARINETRLLGETAMNSLITDVISLGTQSGSATVRNVAVLIDRVGWMFRNFAIKSAMNALGLQFVDALVATTLHGRRNYLKEWRARKRNDHTEQLNDYSHIYRDLDATRAFTKSAALTIFNVMGAQLLFSAGVFTGESDDERKRRKWLETLNMPQWHDPRDVRNDFRNYGSWYIKEGIASKMLELMWGAEMETAVAGDGESERFVRFMPPWWMSMLTSQMTGLARAEATGDVGYIKDAMTNQMLFNPVLNNPATQMLRATLFGNYEDGYDEEAFKSAGGFNLMAALVLSTFFENSFANSLYTGMDKYDRASWEKVEVTEDGATRMGYDGEPQKANVTYQEMGANGEVLSQRVKVEGSELFWRNYMKRNAVSAFIYTTLLGGDDSFWRYNMPPKEIRAYREQLSEQEALGYLAARYDEQVKQLQEEGRVFQNQNPTFTKDLAGTPLTGEALAVYNGLASGKVKYDSPSMQGMYIPYETRERVFHLLMQQEVKAGLQLYGLNDAMALRRAKDMMFGNNGMPSMADLIYDSSIPYSPTIGYRQLNTTYVMGPGGAMYATGIRRDAWSNIFGRVGSVTPGKGLETDILGNTVDPVNNVNIGIRSLERIDESFKRPSDKELLKKLEDIEKAIKDDLDKLRFGGGSSPWGGGYSRYSRGGGSGGGGGYSRFTPFGPLHEPNALTAYAPGLNDPQVRRARLNRERATSTKGRLKQWQ